MRPQDINTIIKRGEKLEKMSWLVGQYGGWMVSLRLVGFDLDLQFIKPKTRTWSILRTLFEESYADWNTFCLPQPRNLPLPIKHLHQLMMLIHTRFWVINYLPTHWTSWVLLFTINFVRVIVIVSYGESKVHCD